MGRGRVVLWACVLVGAIAGHASAGPLEELEQALLVSGGAGRWALRYVYGGEGLALSGDQGETWHALCADGIHPAGWTNPPVRLGRIAIDGHGILHVATFTGLVRDEGAGCGWASDPAFEGRWVTDVVAHPSDPDVLFAVTSDAGGAQNGVQRRDAEGRWASIGTSDEILIGRLLVVERASGGLRFYQGAVRGMYGEPPNERPNFVVRVSDDMGATWDEFAFGETEGKLEIEAVDPTDPDRLVASLRFEAHEMAKAIPDQVLASRDRGASFVEYASVTSFGGADFAPDGRLWIGDRGDSFAAAAPAGLLYAPSLDEAPTKVLDAVPVSCVDHRTEGDEVFVCRTYEAGFVDAQGQGYRRSFAFRETEAMVECGGVSVAGACNVAFTGAWCGASHFPAAPMCCAYENRQGVDAGGCEGVADAGPVDAALDAAPEAGGGDADRDAADAAETGAGGCGCGLASSAERPADGVLVALGLAVLAWRRGRLRRAARS